MVASKLQCGRCHRPIERDASTSLIMSPVTGHSEYVCRYCEEELDQLIEAWFEGKKVKVK